MFSVCRSCISKSLTQRRVVVMGIRAINSVERVGGILLLVLLLGWASVSAQSTDNRIVAPHRAFAGGQLVGTVIDPQGEPVAQAPVRISSTLSGVVIEVETGNDGTFTAEVPDVEEDENDESLEIGIVGLVTALSIGLIHSLPNGVPLEPPDYTESGREIEIVGDWPEIVFEPGTEIAPTGEPVEVPVGRTISPDGQAALTTYYALPTLPVGPSTVAITGTNGETWRTPTHVYAIVSASIDQEELSRGQETEFAYEFDFGEGEERYVPITIQIEGPIRFEQNGLEQLMTVSRSGRATYSGTIQAIQGSPTGIPFEINAMVGLAAGAGAFSDNNGNDWAYCPGKCFLGKKTITDTEGRHLMVRSASNSNNTCTCSCVLFDMSGGTPIKLVEEDQTYDKEGELEGSKWVHKPPGTKYSDYSCRCVEKAN